MTENKNYIVFSNGFTLGQHGTDEVAKRLAERYGTSEKKIKKRLLAGRAAKVKSFSDYRSAEKLVRKLTSYGLNCYVFSPDIEGEVEHDHEHGRYSEASTFHTVSLEDSRYASDPYSEMSVSVHHDDESSTTDSQNELASGWGRRAVLVTVLLALVAFASYKFLNDRSTDESLPKIETSEIE